MGDDVGTIVQRPVDGFAQGIVALQQVVVDGRTPDPARRALVGALNYVLDKFDLYPDHMKGLGIADDAAVMRCAARAALRHGASHPELQRLAADAPQVAAVFGEELAGPLEALIERLPARVVRRGRKADDILASDEVRIAWWRELATEVKSHKPQPVATTEAALKDLRKMVKSGLAKAGVLP